MSIQTKPLNLINKNAIQVLTKELGIVNTIRFMNQFSEGYGNYTEEKNSNLSNIEFNEIIAEIKNNRKKLN